MARINHDRQMAEFLYGRDNTQVECITRMIGKGANTALTENDLVVAFAENVFSRHQELFQGSGEPALEQDGLAQASSAFEQ